MGPTFRLRWNKAGVLQQWWEEPMGVSVEDISRMSEAQFDSRPGVKGEWRTIPTEGRYHVVDTDNFGGDYPNEKFLLRKKGLRDYELTDDPAHAMRFYDKHYAEEFADGLNKEWGQDSPRFFKVVAEGYKLQPGFEP